VSDGRRPRRVAESIRGYLANAFVSELGDPHLAALVITRVDLPPDLGLARIHVRLMIGDDDERERRSAMRSLSRATGRLRRGLGPHLRLKRIPELRFEYDTGHEALDRVAALLGEIESEREEHAGGSPDPDDDAKDAAKADGDGP